MMKSARDHNLRKSIKLTLVQENHMHLRDITKMKLKECFCKFWRRVIAMQKITSILRNEFEVIFCQQNICRNLIQTTRCVSYNGKQSQYYSKRQESSVATKIKESPLVQLILRKLRRLEYHRHTLRMGCVSSYEAIADKLDYNKFFKALEMPDTFFSWYTITELHVWMVMARAMQEGREGEFFRDALVTAFWVDTSNRLKKLEIGSVTGSMREFYEEFQATVFAYDEGLLGNDMILAGALWRRVFGKEYVHPELVEHLVCYIRQQVKLLDSVKRQDLLMWGKIHWTPFDKIPLPYK